MSSTIQHHLHTLQADIIGEIGPDANLISFRGIPYATVEKRWTHSHIQHSLPTNFDATKFGPRCVQRVGHVLVTGGESDPTPGDDEFKCLNLNITVPKDALPSRSTSHASSLLPVMVWIHGGGFAFGANSVARYRALKVSGLAIEAGTPVVLVQIQYRLGALGFVASNDLASELATSSTKDTQQNDTNVIASFPGSYGFIDQRNALQWVQDHIRDFGGDPSNVTAFGVSAGSASIHYHILTGKPLFDRAILMSGSAPTLGPHPFDHHEAAWQNLCRRSNVDADTPSGRLNQLRELTPEAVLNNTTNSPMGPVADGTLLPLSWDVKNPAATRCKSVIVGDTRVEAIVMDSLIGKISQDRFHQLYKSALSDAEGFEKCFGFTSDHLPTEKYRDAMRNFLSVAYFHYPALLVAESFCPVGDAYLYHFEQPSPYPGETLGLPYHGLCALFIYQNHTDEYPAEARYVAEEMGRVWTGFAHGKKPWQPYSKAQCFMRLGPEGKCSMESFQRDKTRDYGYLSWVEKNFEELKCFTQSLSLPV